MPTIPSRPPLDPELFDFEPGHLWVMHCAVGPIPRTSAAGIENLLIKELRPWRLEIPDEIVGIPEGLRRWGGELLGADPTDLAIVPGTTSGLVTLAQSYRWEEGDEVVTPLGEFPANSWPWKVLSNRGVSLRQVPLWPGHKAGAEAFESSPPQPGVDPETRLLAALGPRTRILSVSWMRFQDGLLLDLERLAAGCRDRGVDLVVDGIQAAGTVPISLRDLPGISAWTAGGQKGLLAPQGLGLLWTSPEFRNRLRPAGGWLGIEDIFDFDLPMTDLDRAQTVDHTRIELGVPNIMLAKAMAASLEALEQADVEAIRIWVNHLQSRLLEGLASSPRWSAEAARLDGLRREGRLGSCLCFHPGEGGLEKLNQVLHAGFERQIYASVRDGYLRVALHGFHREEDIAPLVAWLG